MNEVIRPDVIAVLRSQPDAGAVVEPKTAPLPLFVGDFQPFPPPQPFDALVVDQPAGLTKQGRDTAITVPAILTSQFDHVGNEAVFVRTALRDTTLRRPVLTEHATGPSFRHAKPFVNVIDAVTTTGGAQKFPLAASSRISLFNVRSDTARRNRSFSFSSSFGRFSWSVFMPPYSLRQR